MKPAILSDVEGAGHRVFVVGEYNVNVIGVRRGVTPDAFDDELHLAYRVGGQWRHHVYPCTTDPGLYWLRAPMNVKGTAVLCPGQYRGSHAIGQHQNRYTALVQVGPVKVWRDADRDGVLGFRGDIDEGLFGINIHRASGRAPSPRVGKWSAGCQVIQDPRDFVELMGIVRHSVDLYGPRITYTLLDGRS